MKKVIYLFTSFLFFANIHAQSVQWARSAGEIERDAGRAVCTDKEGNVIVAGYFSGKIMFDSLYQGRGTDDAFIAKFNDEGDLLWVQTAGGFREDAAYGVDTDAEGNIYVTGDFDSLIIFGNKVLFSSGGKDIFIAKYNSSGQFIWAERAGGIGNDGGNAIAVDKDGNSYVTGKFESFASFGTQVITSNGFLDIFFAKYDSDGNLMWVKKAGGVKEDVGLGIAVDTFGNCYATGYFNDNVNFQVATLSTASTSSEIFIVKIDSVSEFEWAHQAGGLRGDVGYAIAVDEQRNSYITGYFTDFAYFGLNTLTNVSYNDIFVAKYSAKGVCLWAKSAGGRLLDIGTGIDVGPDGSVYVTGVIDSVVYFETDTIFQSRKDDVFLAKWDVNGNYQWVKTAGGSNSQIGLAVSVGRNKSVYFTGYFYSQIDFGDTIIYQPNDADIFLAKLYDPLLSVIETNGKSVLLKVYPNPAASYVNVVCNEAINEKTDIVITDVSGRIVYSIRHDKISDSVIEIDISKLNDGIYFLNVSSKNFSSAERLSVIR